MTPLCELAKFYGSDKGGEHLKAGDTCHNYTKFYHEMFKDRRNDVEAVLEIGIAHGHSLRMWRDYSPQALIFGIDHNPACMFEEPRIRCFTADQYDEDALHRVMGNLRGAEF